MNIKGLLRVAKRRAKSLDAVGVKGPFFTAADKKEVIFTDGYAAVKLPAKWVIEYLEPEPEVGEEAYTKMRVPFEATTADRSAFQTTVQDVLTWLRSSTEACPLCEGTKLCQPSKRHEREFTPEEEDAESVHYGWVGSSAIDRRHLEELLTYLEVLGEEEVELVGVVDHGGNLSMRSGIGADAIPVSAQGVVLSGKAWRIYVAGRTDQREAAPKFHLEGTFHHPTFTAAKKGKHKR